MDIHTNTSMNANTDQTQLLSQSTHWRLLKRHWRQMAPISMNEMFANNSQRFDQFSARVGDLLFDYSKNKIDKKTIDILLGLAQKQKVTAWRQRLFNGDAINHTQNRAVLHTALRGEHVGVDIPYELVMKVDSVLNRMEVMVNALRSGQWHGATGKRITDVVHIGIGGSDLGPKMVTKALTPYHCTGIKVHFVSSIDASNLHTVVKGLDQESTLFLVASKSFGTEETLTNANSARQWLLAKNLPPTAIQQHFVAMTSNIEAATRFGLHPDHIFPMWDWVGGRFSLWSCIGLPIAIAVGMTNFRDLLVGAYIADDHFLTAPLARNVPVLMAMLGIWYRNFGGYSNHAVLPYDHYLTHFTEWLQQVDMESNGKHTDRDGLGVDYATAPIIWGGTGTDGQHAYFQLMHQGTERSSCDFIAVANSANEIGQHQTKLLANCFAQSQALMQGQRSDEGHLNFAGDKPSNTLLMDALTPSNLGTLIATYEHKIFVQGVIWNLNSYDQWGVELGKNLAQSLSTEMHQGRLTKTYDSSTRGLTNISLRLRARHAQAKQEDEAASSSHTHVDTDTSN